MKLPALLDWKTPALYVLGLTLLASVASLVWQHVELADVRAELAAERQGRAEDRAIRAEEDRERADLALADRQQVAARERGHAAKQQELAHALTQTQLALAQERDRRRAADGRLRDTASQLEAARDRLETQGDAAPSCYPADQYRSLLGLVAESGRLAARCSELVGEGRELVVRRDAEVKALKDQVMNDRELIEQVGP